MSQNCVLKSDDDSSSDEEGAVKSDDDNSKTDDEDVEPITKVKYTAVITNLVYHESLYNRERFLCVEVTRRN